MGDFPMMQSEFDLCRVKSIVAAVDDKFATGVYAIIHRASGKRYIGSAARSFSERWSKHRHYLRYGKHHSPHLQRAWDRDGASAFEFVILEKCEPAKCVEREQHYIDLYKANDGAFGYNMCPLARSALGFKVSDERRARMRETARNRPACSDETRQLFSDNLKAKWADPVYREERRRLLMAGRTPEGNARISQKNKGRRHTEEAKAKIAEASRNMSPESREKRSQSLIASGAHRRASEKLRGRKLSPETIERMRASKTGVPKSAEHRAATAAAITLWHAQRRRINEWFDAHLGMRPNQIDWEVAA